MLWAVGGAVLGLIVTTLVMGLAQASFIPMTDDQVMPFRIKIAFLAVLVVFGTGWLFAGSIHPHLLQLWKRRAEPLPGERPAKGPINIQKQP